MKKLNRFESLVMLDIHLMRLHLNVKKMLVIIDIVKGECLIWIMIIVAIGCMQMLTVMVTVLLDILVIIQCEIVKKKLEKEIQLVIFIFRILIIYGMKLILNIVDLFQVCFVIERWNNLQLVIPDIHIMLLRKNVKK